MSALIELERVSVTYGAVEAVREVTLTIAPGETLALVGPSGCGKSTLARALVGLEPLSGGAIRAEGRALSLATTAARRAHASHVQLVFQDAGAALDPRWSVLACVEEPLVIHERGDRTRRALEALSAVGLPEELARRRPAQLSAGQRQRVGLARALVLEPKLLVLDEPVSALDVSVQAQVLELLARLRAERQTAMLLITHDLAVAASLAQRVAVMNAGQLVELAETAVLLRSPQHVVSQALLAAAKRFSS